MGGTGLDGSIPEGMPVYEFIKQGLKRQIDDGELPEGERVPSELELARQLGVSRSQTRQALRDLEMAGYLTRAPGRGSFVAPASERSKRLGIKGFRMVGMACPSMEFSYRRSVIDGFREHMAAHGIETMLYFFRPHDPSALRFVEETRNSGIEGLAIWCPNISDAAAAVLTRFREESFPFVQCDRYFRDLDADFVVTDNEDTAYRLTKALIGQGHERIGFIALDYAISPTQDRIRGCKRALTEAGLPVLDALIGGAAEGPGAKAAVITRILAHRHRPTAILCSDDRVVLFILEVLDKLEYTVPDDLALAAVDDDHILDELNLTIYRSRQDGYEIGRQSAEVLLARIVAPRKSADQRYIPSGPVSTSSQGTPGPGWGGKEVGQHADLEPMTGLDRVAEEG